MGDSGDLFLRPGQEVEPPKTEWPKWYRPSKLRQVLNRRVAMGLHPMGGELGPDDSTCGSCEHLFRRSMGSTYLKCTLVSMSHSASTDVRAGWRGCAKWKTKST